MKEFAGKHILVIIENLPAPFDRRVWQEASTLNDNGAHITIICPKMKGYTKSYECIDGIDIYRHPLPVEGAGPLGYLQEYGTALFFQFFLSWRIFLRRRFHIIHACNPPDLMFITALPFKLLGVKFVFDHHDINPELFVSKYNKKGFFYFLMILFEKVTFKVSDYSIATNESYKEIALNRGKMHPNRVAIVRSGPDLSRLRLTTGNIIYKKGRKLLVGFVGVIGEQEGLDLLLESIVQIVRVKNRDDIQFAIIGDGTDLQRIKDLSRELDLDDFIDFYGRVSDEKLVDILNTADICVNPDKPTEMNNLSTMNKIMEYMSLKKPIVQFDLKEGKFSAQKASLYANNVFDFSEKIIQLADDEDLRKDMGEFGYNRVINDLNWNIEKKNLLKFYNKIFLS
jgi:glycosyltransferase involved in cell wall biosynthesis